MQALILRAQPKYTTAGKEPILWYSLPLCKDWLQTLVDQWSPTWKWVTTYTKVMCPGLHKHHALNLSMAMHK